jgi:hypothetical protein
MRFQELLNISNHLFFKVLTALILSYFQMARLNWIVKINLHDLITKNKKIINKLKYTHFIIIVFLLLSTIAVLAEE